jgi:hypothetical protein
MTRDLAGRFLLNNIHYLTKKQKTKIFQENEIIAECEGSLFLSSGSIITFILT